MLGSVVSKKHFIIKFFQAISWVKWLNSEKTNVLKTISVPVTLRMRTEMVFETLDFSPFKHLT